MSNTQHAQHVAAYRDLLIDKAVSARKISAERASEFRSMFDRSPLAVANLLTAPVDKGGLMAGINMGGKAFAASEEAEYPAEWLGQPAPRGTVAYEDPTARVDAAAGYVPDGQPNFAAAPRNARASVTFE